MSNQRGLASLIYIYTEDYDGYLPVRRTVDQFNIYQYSWVNLVWKYAYTGTKLKNKYEVEKLHGSTLNCPESLTDISDDPNWGRIYALNQWFKMLNGKTLSARQNASVRMQEIKNKSSVFLTVEHANFATWAGKKWIFAQGAGASLSGTSQKLINHHTASKGTNASFVDGHVKFMNTEDFPHNSDGTFVQEKNDERWNGATLQ